MHTPGVKVMPSLLTVAPWGPNSSNDSPPILQMDGLAAANLFCDLQQAQTPQDQLPLESSMETAISPLCVATESEAQGTSSAEHVSSSDMHLRAVDGQPGMPSESDGATVVARSYWHNPAPFRADAAP